jgi:hypothetical protein
VEEGLDDPEIFIGNIKYILEMVDTDIMTEILKVDKKSLLKLFNINFTKLKENKKQFYNFNKIIVN